MHVADRLPLVLSEVIYACEFKQDVLCSLSSSVEERHQEHSFHHQGFFDIQTLTKPIKDISNSKHELSFK